MKGCRNWDLILKRASAMSTLEFKSGTLKVKVTT